MIGAENGSQPRSVIFISLVIASVAANMQGLGNAWIRTGAARDLPFYLTLAAHFVLVVQYAVRFIGVGLRYRVDNTISGWVSSGFVALVSYIAANAVAAPDWWIGLYAVLTLGAVVKDWELRNWAKRKTEKGNDLTRTALMRRFEDTAIAESLLSAFFFILFIIVKTTLGANLGLDGRTAVTLASAFALVVTVVSLSITLSRARDLSAGGEVGADRGVAGTASMPAESGGGE